MILLVGVLLIALGLISGAALLASEMGWLIVTHGITLWFMFPFGSALGLLIVALTVANPTLWATALSMLVAIVPLWRTADTAKVAAPG